MARIITIVSSTEAPDKIHQQTQYSGFDFQNQAQFLTILIQDLNVFLLSVEKDINTRFPPTSVPAPDKEAKEEEIANLKKQLDNILDKLNQLNKS